MATTKKKDFFIGMGAAGAITEAAMRLSLDPDIYGTDILNETGLSAVSPAATIGVVGVTLEQADRSNRASLLKVSCYIGTDLDTATDTRNIKIICEQSKVDTAVTTLIDKTVVLGIGVTAKTWKIGRVR